MHDKVTKALYRTLLRTIKHYTSKRNGPILSSLLHRSGSDDNIDYFEANQMKLPQEDAQAKAKDLCISRDRARDLSQPYSKKKEFASAFNENYPNWNQDKYSDSGVSNDARHIILYKALLKEIIGPGVYMNFPSMTDGVMTRLRAVLGREFRGGGESVCKRLSCTDKNRRETAFLALKELQKRLAFAEKLGFNLDVGDYYEGEEDSAEIQNLVAKDVMRLPQHPDSINLKPGIFLVAHPLLTGYFSKTVICILEHTEPQLGDESCGSADNDNNSINGPMRGTYGLIVNKRRQTGVPDENSKRMRDRTLREVIRADHMPQSVKAAFGDSPVRNGGPVNLSIQMLRYASVDEEEKCKLGGSVLSMDMDGTESSCQYLHGDSEDPLVQSTAIDTDFTVYYGGDFVRASQAVLDNDMEKDSFSFLIGASCWGPGQLQDEIKKGYWIPCSGPLQTAFFGSCSINGTNDVKVSETSLWIAFMSALGREDGQFAQIFEACEPDLNCLPCDEIY